MISATLHADVDFESEVAEDRYVPFASTHEAYGVLAEEMAELLDAIRANNLDAVATEAVQVAAVAMRLAETIVSNSEEMRRRSVKGEESLQRRRGALS